MALDPMTTKHSITNALALAQCSQLAYSDAADIRNGLPAAVGSPVLDFKILNIAHPQTHGFLALFDKAIVLCFQGTKTFENWLEDGEILLVPFRHIGFIHHGFRNSFDSVYDEALSTLQQWGKLPGGRTLWITGHSLGGALALVAAAYLRFPADPTKILPRPIAGLYTFGQPRVGTHAFCQACDANFGITYFRYINNEDIVTRVPPREIGYWHGGIDEYMDENGVIHEDPVRWQLFLDRVAVGMAKVRELRITRPELEFIKDHAIKLYIEAIEKNLPS